MGLVTVQRIDADQSSLPMRLVQAIGSTAPLFVYLFGITLFLTVPALGEEDMSRSTVLRKTIATMLVVIGMILIST